MKHAGFIKTSVLVLILFSVVLFLGVEVVLSQLQQKTYTHPTYGYSVEIPAGWKQRQKEDQGEIIFTNEKDKLAFEIITFEYHKPVSATDSAELDRIFKAAPGEKVDSSAKKIANLTLDKCQAAQIAYPVEKGWIYWTICAGKARSLSILFKPNGINFEDLTKQKPLYDQILATFKFNNFSLD